MDGSIVTGRFTRLAVMRYLHDLDTAHERGFYFCEDAANDIIDFYTNCVHTQGSDWANKPIYLEPWQKFIVWNIFGWRCESDHTRRFRKAFIEVARKNGKTTMLAPILIYLMGFDYMPGVEGPSEFGAQGYCAATKEDQAKLLFNEVSRMLKSSPNFREYLQTGLIVCKDKEVIFNTSGDSRLKVLGSDSDTQDGYNIHACARDEVHAWRQRHRGLAEKLASADGSRSQPLDLAITTAGDDDSVIWAEEHGMAEKCVESVLTGHIVSDEMFSFIAAIDWQPFQCFACLGADCPWCHGTGTVDPDDPLEDFACIAKANPNAGVSKKDKSLELKWAEAREFVHKRNEFLRYQCNVRVAATERAIQPELWAACAGELSDWNTATRIHGGFDLGRANDFAAAAMFAEFSEVDADGEQFTRYEIRGRSFTSRIRDKNMQLPFIDRWIADELLEAADGDAVDFHAVEAWIVAQSALWGVRTWAFDKTFAHQMSLSLQNDHGLTVFPFTQAAHFYNEPIRRFLLLLTQTRITQDGRSVRLLTHDGNPVTAWQAGNLIIRRNGKDEWMPDKGASTNKIDEMVSNLMALSECLFSAKQNDDPDYYATPGSLRC